MLSYWLSLGSLFLGFLCTSSSPTSNGDEALILDPLFEDGSSVQPQWIHEPRNLEQLNDEQESNYVKCGQTHRLDRGQSVAIKSKSRNGKYLKKEDCRWTFETIDSNSTLTISCGLFQLRACKQSSLRITGGGYSERFCKRRSKLTKTINDNNMKVYFRTSSSQMRRKGFSCTVTASGKMEDFHFVTLNGYTNFVLPFSRYCYIESLRFIRFPQTFQRILFSRE
ncbi:uncharacterized protein [Palaemon carinicauda]|uniref:uncharacterized protein n=1 Tax=Palaemon carinicauda TaxID=392227 RepID=UPI0035B66422